MDIESKKCIICDKHNAIRYQICCNKEYVHEQCLKTIHNLQCSQCGEITVVCEIEQKMHPIKITRLEIYIIFLIISTIFIGYNSMKCTYDNSIFDNILIDNKNKQPITILLLLGVGIADIGFKLGKIFMTYFDYCRKNINRHECFIQYLFPLLSLCITLSGIIFNISTEKQLSSDIIQLILFYNFLVICIIIGVLWCIIHIFIKIINVLKECTNEFIRDCCMYDEPSIVVNKV